MASISPNQQAPGLPSGTKYGSFSTDLLINDNAQVAFGAGGSTRESSSLYKGPINSPSLVATAGQTAPGAPAGTTFQAFNEYSISNSGAVAFTARTQGLDDQGIWVQDASGNLSLGVYANMPATAVGPGVTFRAIDDPIINSSGDIAFRARLQGPGINSSTELSTWTIHDGQLSLIASRALPIPGLGLGFDTHVSTDSDFIPILNDAGQLILTGHLSNSADAVLAYDLTGTLLTSVMAGDQVVLGPGDVRTLLDVEIEFDFDTEKPPRGSNGHDGMDSPFNDAGQIAILATFSDRVSQAIIIVQVPEPSSYVLATMAMLALVAVRRRR